MTVRKILSIGDPILFQPSDAVDDIGRPSVQEIIDDMLDTLADAQGLGLAAPQIGATLRIIVALNCDSRAYAASADPVVLINPVLDVAREARTNLDIEGCLSVPSLRGLVPRASAVTFRGSDRFGAPLAGVAYGLFACILQHEIDHLDGKLFLERVNDPRRLASIENLHHLIRMKAALEHQA